MAIKYKIDVLAALKEKGYSTYKLVHDAHWSPSLVQRLRAGEPIIGVKSLELVCDLLDCQPGDILEFSRD